MEHHQMAEETEKTEARDDADAGQKLDKILAHMDGLTKRMDALEGKKADAEDKEEKEEYDDSDMEFEDSDEEKEEKADEDGEFEGDPKRVAADKRKKADEAEEKEEKSDSKKMDAKADAVDVRKEIKRVEAMIPKQMSDADYAKMADAQARADKVYAAFSDSAPRPLQGENLDAYRRRLAGGLKKHSSSLSSVDLNAIKDPAAFDFMEKQIFSDAMAAAMNPSDLGEGVLREINERDITGRVITRFVGEAKSWMSGFSGQRQRLTGIRRD
jgi:hypothetical protein